VERPQIRFAVAAPLAISRGFVVSGLILGLRYPGWSRSQTVCTVATSARARATYPEPAPGLSVCGVADRLGSRRSFAATSSSHWRQFASLADRPSLPSRSSRETLRSRITIPDSAEIPRGNPERLAFCRRDAGSVLKGSAERSQWCQGNKDLRPVPRPNIR
jgi:hypothetical protein